MCSCNVPFILSSKTISLGGEPHNSDHGKTSLSQELQKDVNWMVENYEGERIAACRFSCAAC